MSDKSTFHKSEAQLESTRKWKRNNKDKVKAYNKWYNETHPEKLKTLAHIRNTQRIRFNGPQIDLDHNPRIGVCNKCRFVGQTHLHHEKYDKSNPLAHTIELCIPCQNKERNNV